MANTSFTLLWRGVTKLSGLVKALLGARTVIPMLYGMEAIARHLLSESIEILKNVRASSKASHTVLAVSGVVRCFV